jgi:hypothetical protein
MSGAWSRWWPSCRRPDRSSASEDGDGERAANEHCEQAVGDVSPHEDASKAVLDRVGEAIRRVVPSGRVSILSLVARR